MNVSVAPQASAGGLPPELQKRLQDGVDQRVDRRLDRRSARIDERLQSPGELETKAAEQGYDARVDERLERRSDRIDGRQGDSTLPVGAADVQAASGAKADAKVDVLA